MSAREAGRARRWVVKLGSALLTRDGRGLDVPAIDAWAAQCVQLCQRGVEVVIVSSAAVAEGMNRLGLHERPESLNALQALAAVGQMGLVHVYEQVFQAHGRHTAQVLLTHEDVADRRRYLNARSTLRTLLEFGVTPIINENDTVATSELRFGDNDTLAGLVSNLVEAETLVILTDQAGLYTADPRRDPAAQLVRSGRAGDPELEALAGPGSTLGRGGMQTKLRAAALAARSGTGTFIVSGREERVLLRLLEGDCTGTWLAPASAPLAARKQWLAGQVRTRGALVLDDGAVAVLRRSGRSLLAVGIQAVQGRFGRGEVVSCRSAQGEEIARGLVNYDASEVERVLGLPSEQISQRLGYVREPEVIHRDNLVVLERAGVAQP
jgi:glutamate 5-kinase